MASLHDRQPFEDAWERAVQLASFGTEWTQSCDAEAEPSLVFLHDICRAHYEWRLNELSDTVDPDAIAPPVYHLEIPDTEDQHLYSQDRPGRTRPAGTRTVATPNPGKWTNWRR